MIYYLTGTTIKPTGDIAKAHAIESGRLSVVRDGTINFLTFRPVQPGQAPFRIQPGEKLINDSRAAKFEAMKQQTNDGAYRTEIYGIAMCDMNFDELAIAAFYLATKYGKAVQS